MKDWLLTSGKKSNTEILARCRAKLEETARKRDLISYSKLASHMGIANQGVGPYLNAIYQEETELDHPDLTLVAVYAGTRYGRFNSRGGPAQSVKVNPDKPEDRQKYDDEVKRVWDFWTSGK